MDSITWRLAPNWTAYPCWSNHLAIEAIVSPLLTAYVIVIKTKAVDWGVDACSAGDVLLVVGATAVVLLDRAGGVLVREFDEVPRLRDVRGLFADQEGGREAVAAGFGPPVDPAGRVATTAVLPRRTAMPALSRRMSNLRFMDAPHRPQA